MKEFIDNYNIFEDGRIQRKGGKFLKPETMGNGYQRVTLCSNGNVKRWLLHRLIASVYIPNPNNLPVINHIDGNKQNNQVSNLEWTTYAKNENHSYRVLAKQAVSCEEHYNAKLTAEDVRDIREIDNINYTQTAKDYGVNRQTIYDAYNYITWNKVF